MWGGVVAFTPWNAYRRLRYALRARPLVPGSVLVSSLLPVRAKHGSIDLYAHGSAAKYPGRAAPSHPLVPEVEAIVVPGTERCAGVNGPS
jgi:hypothetical protein